MSRARITANDIVVWLMCSKAYAHGYDAQAIFGQRQQQYAIEQALATGDDIAKPLRKTVSNAKEAEEWWYTTDLFAFLAGSSVYTAPPSPNPAAPATDAQWRRFGPRNRGLVTVPRQKHEIAIEFTLPYMHASRNKTRYECVVFDTTYDAHVDEVWSTLVQLSRVHGRLFHLATQKHLYTRYVNFATCTEKVIDAKPIELDWAITLSAIADEVNYARPGIHCHYTSRNKYLCNARANNQCPIW